MSNLAGKTMFVLSDQHYTTPDCSEGGVDPAAESCALQAVALVKPDIFVNIGDAGEWNSVSHWKFKKVKRPPLEYQLRELEEEAKYVNAGLDLWDVALKVAGCKEKHFIEGNHECLDPETELLTNRGWIHYTDIDETDQVLSFNSGKVSWNPINKVIVKDFEGNLNLYTNTRINLCCTDKHRILYKRRGLGRFGFYRYNEFKDLPHGRISIPVSGQSIEEGNGITDPELTLLGWILTDGHVARTGTSITIYQALSKASLVETALNNVKIEYTRRERTRKISSICGRPLLKTPQPEVSFRIGAKNTRKLLRLFHIDFNKNLPSWVSCLNDKQFDVLLQALVDGDGTRPRTSVNSLVLYGVKRFLDQVQAAAISHGWAASLSLYRTNDYRLNLTKTEDTQFDFHPKDCDVIPYSGKVWCVNTPLSNFAVRRKGRAFFVGNCWLDNLATEHPYIKATVAPEKIMRLKERGYKYHPYGKYVKFGKLALYHGGHFSTQHHAYQHVTKLGHNVMYGHVHDQQTAKIPTLGGMRGAWSIGCICKMEKAFLQGRPTNWSHAFAIVHFFEGGRFNVEIVEILDGVCHVYGKKLCA